MVIKPSEVRNLIISGFFITIGLVVTMIFIFMLSTENAVFIPKIQLKARVENVQNLKEGAAVQLRGLKVGTVQEITFLDVNTIEITMGVDSSYQKWIKKDSFVAFRTQGVLGDRFLEILGGSPGAAQVQSGAQLRVESSSQIDQFINKGEDILIVAGRVLQKIDRILGKVEENRIQTILGNLEGTTKSLKSLSSSIEQAGLDEMIVEMKSASGQLEQTAGSVQNITKRIEKGPGTLNSLIYDNSTYEDIQYLLGGAKRNKVLKYFIRESIRKADPDGRN